MYLWGRSQRTRRNDSRAVLVDSWILRTAKALSLPRSASESFTSAQSTEAKRGWGWGRGVGRARVFHVAGLGCSVHIERTRHRKGQETHKVLKHVVLAAFFFFRGKIAASPPERQTKSRGRRLPSPQHSWRSKIRHTKPPRESNHLHRELLRLIVAACKIRAKTAGGTRGAFAGANRNHHGMAPIREQRGNKPSAFRCFTTARQVLLKAGARSDNAAATDTLKSGKITKTCPCATLSAEPRLPFPYARSVRSTRHTSPDAN